MCMCMCLLTTSFNKEPVEVRLHSPLNSFFCAEEGNCMSHVSLVSLSRKYSDPRIERKTQLNSNCKTSGIAPFATFDLRDYHKLIAQV